MTNLSVPLVPTSIPKPSSLNDMKTKTHLIRWCDPVLKDLGTDKQFSNGANTYWAQDDNIIINDDRIDIFEPNTNYPNRGCELKVKAGSEHHYIAYVEFDMGRHFTKPFTWMGVEWFQSQDTNNSCHIKKIGREYKRESNGFIYNHSTSFYGESNKETVGYFHFIDSMHEREIAMQEDGYLFNRLYFNLRTTSGAGSAHTSSCSVFNLRFGWGEGEPSTNHMIALPKIRPFEEQTKPAYGEES